MPRHKSYSLSSNDLIANSKCKTNPVWSLPSAWTVPPDNHVTRHFQDLNNPCTSNKKETEPA